MSFKSIVAAKTALPTFASHARAQIEVTILVAVMWPLSYFIGFAASQKSCSACSCTTIREDFVHRRKFFLADGRGCVTLSADC
jgi:hypothetical protein